MTLGALHLTRLWSAGTDRPIGRFVRKPTLQRRRRWLLSIQLGARLFEIALLPSLVPAFSDSANNLNPGFTALVPQLQAEFPDAVFGLSNWGPFYDDILKNPAEFGITNTTDPCFNFATRTACSDPDKHFYYIIVHPSDVAHHIVGNDLFTEVLALPSPVPEPATWAMMLLGFVGLGFALRQPRRMVSMA
jgi:cholinesterase